MEEKVKSTDRMDHGLEMIRSRFPGVYARAKDIVPGVESMERESGSSHCTSSEVVIQSRNRQQF